MSDSLKVSGKRFQLPDPTASNGDWKFEERPGGWIIATTAKGDRFRLALHEFRGKLAYQTRTHTGFGELIHRSAASGSSAGDLDSELTAQFPGKVRKILVKENEMLEPGTPMILVEAMKMEFAIKAPAQGKITKILVQEGQQLAPGSKFVEFEAVKENVER